MSLNPTYPVALATTPPRFASYALNIDGWYNDGCGDNSFILATISWINLSLASSSIVLSAFLTKASTSSFLIAPGYDLALLS